MRAHARSSPLWPAAPTPHPTPASPLPTPGSHVQGVSHCPHPTPPRPRHYPHLACLRLPIRSPHPPAPSPPPPPTPHPTPASPLLTPREPPRPHHPHRPHHTTPASPPPPPGSHVLGVERVFKGCQCMPTPPRALTTPTARTQPGPHFLATTHTWLAFPRCLVSILWLPMRAHTPRPHHPHRPHPIPPRPRHYPHLARMF